MPLYIPPHRPSVVLRHRAGTTLRYASIDAAYRALGYHWIARNVAREFGEFVHVEYLDQHTRCDWILRTDSGEALTAQDFHERWSQERSERVRLRQASDYFFNGSGPVPGTGRRHGGGMYRRYAHMNGHRAAALVLVDEGEVAPRAARGLRGVPDPWAAERLFAAREDRSWKRYRRTQWKPQR